MLESIVEDLSKVDDNIFLSENGTQFDQAGFYIMRFATGVQFLDIGYFSPELLDEALLAYDNYEGIAFAASEAQSIINFDDVVLAYARDGEQLGLAFPNYSAKVGRFLEHIKPYL